MATKKKVDPEIIKRLDQISKQLETLTSRLNLTINLLLDMVLSNEKLKEPHGVTEKVEWLDSSMRFPLRPSEAADILGRRAGDISSRRKEIADARKKGRKIRKIRIVPKASPVRTQSNLDDRTNQSGGENE